MIFFNRFHLMFQNLNILDMILSIKFIFQKKNLLIKQELFRYEVKNVNLLFFNSGRKALSFILNNISIEKKNLNNEILVPSFTCEVVPIEVLKNDFKPIYYDLCPISNNILSIIKKKVSLKTKAIIYQHSFGRHDDISEIKKFCKIKNIILIEDKALCFLSKKKKLPELQGDFAYYSFENSKTISSRMGGMMIFSQDKKINLIYKNNFYYNFLSDIRTFLSILTYNIKGDIGFAIRKIFVFFHILKKSIDQEDLDIKFKNKIQYYNLTPFQKCLLIHQLKKLKRKYSICKKNVKFWSNLLPDLDIEVIQDYFFYYPVRLRYNGYHSHKIKEILKNMGLKQDDWFEGGIGSRSFDKKKINFRLQNFKYTKKFCSNYTNLPTLINLSKNFKEEVTLKMNSKK